MADLMVDHHGAIACEITARLLPILDSIIPTIEVDDDVVSHAAAVLRAASRVERWQILRLGQHYGEVATLVGLGEGRTGSRPTARIVEHAVHGVGESVQFAHVPLARDAVLVLCNALAALVRGLIRLRRDLRGFLIADRGRERIEFRLFTVLRRSGIG